MITIAQVAMAQAGRAVTLPKGEELFASPVPTGYRWVACWKGAAFRVFYTHGVVTPAQIWAGVQGEDDF